MKRIHVLLPCVLAAASTAAFAGTPLDEARVLMKAGKPSQAYSLLAPGTASAAKDADYLYTTAVAALDAGQAEQAIPLFEAALRLDPENGGALIDLGRAHFMLGQREAARSRFEAAQKLNPPATAARVIDRYLAALKEQENVLAPMFHAFVEGGLGHDDNINNATDQSRIAVPLFGNAVLTLNPTNVGTRSGYTVISAGADVIKPLNTTLAVYGAVSFSARNHFDHRNFDNLSPDLRGGVIFAEGRHFFRAGLFGSQYYLDGGKNRETTGINADWYYVVTPQDRAGVFAQYADYRYRNVLSAENFEQSLLGGSWSHRYSDATEVSTALFAAVESADRRVDGDKGLWALKATVQHKLSDAVQLIGGVGYQEGRYDRRNVLFLKKRRDEQYDVNVGVNYRIDASWSLRAQWTHIDNQSNIALNRFDRNDVSVTIRRDF